MFILKSQGIKRKRTQHSTLDAGRHRREVFLQRSSFFFPLLISMGAGRGFGEGGMCNFFPFPHWLLSYLLQRDASPHLIGFSIFYSPSWMLGTPPPHPVVSGQEGCLLCRGEEARGSGGEGGRPRGTCLTCFCWISALLLLECWALIESFMVLKVLFWQVSPLIPERRGDPWPREERLPHTEALRGLQPPGGLWRGSPFFSPSLNLL